MYSPFLLPSSVRSVCSVNSSSSISSICDGATTKTDYIFVLGKLFYMSFLPAGTLCGRCTRPRRTGSPALRGSATSSDQHQTKGCSEKIWETWFWSQIWRATHNAEALINSWCSDAPRYNFQSARCETHQVLVISTAWLATALSDRSQSIANARSC